MPGSPRALPGKGEESCRHQLLSPAPAGSSHPALPVAPADPCKAGRSPHTPATRSFRCICSRRKRCSRVQVLLQGQLTRCSPTAPTASPFPLPSPPTPAPLPFCRAWRVFTKPIAAAMHPSSPRDLPASSSVMSRLELQEKRSTAPYCSPASAGGRAPSSYAPRFFQYRNILGPRPGGRGGQRCCPRCRVPGGGWLGRPHGAVPTAPAPPGPPVGLAGGARLRL